MKLEHFGVAANSEEDADRFFTELLGLEKVRELPTAPGETMEKFFGSNLEMKIARYESEHISVEVFFTGDDSKKTDTYSHVSFIMDDRDPLLKKAKAMGFPVIQVPRENSDVYYLFIKDAHGNLYEIKQPW